VSFTDTDQTQILEIPVKAKKNRSPLRNRSKRELMKITFAYENN